MDSSLSQIEVRNPVNRTLLWPRWWRWTVIGLSVLTLCSCRGMSKKSAAPVNVTRNTAPPLAMHSPQTHPLMETGYDVAPAAHVDGLPRENGMPRGSKPRGAVVHAVGHPSQGNGQQVMPVQYESLPPSAYTGEPQPHCPRVAMPGEQPVPFWASQWAPPGIQRPWPPAEYIHDGGDRGKPARTGKDWRIHGLESEDTIAHFDTLDGRVMVEPSNRVHIYAPRFGVVRRVNGLKQYASEFKAHSGETAVAALNEEQRLDPGAVLQPQGALDSVATRSPTVQQRDLPSVIADRTLTPAEATVDLMPYENFSIVRNGIAEQADKPLLAIHVDAAIVWSHDLGVKVEIDGQTAQVETGDQRAQATYTIDNPNRSSLRIVKVASREAAQPGDFVDFTLRFDNTGTEPIGNVTIVDNLTTRLEYVPDTEKSTLDAEFLTEVNDSGSLVLRWEIANPLEVGEGGVIRFRCRVR